MTEIVTNLTEIIKLEAKIIDDMFLLLMQHISTEDESMKSIVDRIGEVAALQAETDLQEEELPF